MEVDGPWEEWPKQLRDNSVARGGANRTLTANAAQLICAKRFVHNPEHDAQRKRRENDHRHDGMSPFSFSFRIDNIRLEYDEGHQRILHFSNIHKASEAFIRTRLS